MSRHLLPLLVLLVTGIPLRAEITIPGRFDDNLQYIYITISDAALSRSPAWKPEAANPPVSAREAIRLASGKKPRILPDTKNFKWQLESVRLLSAGDSKWYWVVEYQEHPRPGVMLDGVPGMCRFVVLMDGTVLEPKAQALGSR
jgi:hypothetical protein